MNKKQFIIFISFLAFATISVNAQQTIKKTLNLQLNEQYTLGMTQLYNLPAIDFKWPSNLPYQQLVIPYQQFDTYRSTGTPYKVLAYITVDSNTKYYLGVDIVNKQNNLQDVTLIYFSLTIFNGLLNRQNISSLLIYQDVDFLNGDIYASFINENSGFITQNFQGRDQFLYFVNKSPSVLELTPVPQLLFTGQFTALQDPLKSSNIYIIYLATYYYIELYTYDVQAQKLSHVGFYDVTEKPEFLTVLVAENNFFIFHQIYSLLISVEVNFPTQQLVVNKNYFQLMLPYSKAVFLQKIRDSFILTLSGETSKSYQFLRFKQQDFVNYGSYKNVDFNFARLNLESPPVFIDENNFVYFSQNTFYLFNLEQQQTTFCVPISADYSYNSQYFLGNQMFIYKYDSSLNTYLAIPITFQVPALILIGKNEVYNLIVYPNQQKAVILIEITVNVVQSMTTTFNQNNLLVENLLSYYYTGINYVFISEYLTGSNLNPQISTNSQYVTDLKFINLIELYVQQTYDTAGYSNVFSTDGIVSSVIVTNKGGSYTLSLALLNSDLGGTNQVTIYSEASSVYNDQIGQIDNYGSFILLNNISEQSKLIYLPFVSSRILQYNYLSSKCSSSNFSFASDPNHNILFTLCSSTLIQYNYQVQSGQTSSQQPVIIMSQQILNLPSQQAFNKLICIRGKLYIYSSTQITLYDYIEQAYSLSTITIPANQDGNNQEVILFSDTFIVIVQDNPVTIISQYSYGQFKSSTPIFLRNFFIDKNYPINPTLNLIPKRNQDELLLIGSVNKNEYLIYKINDSYSQNQLYTNVYIPNDDQNIPVISSEQICNLSAKVNCRSIKDGPYMSYNLTMDESTFNSQLSTSIPITLTIDQQQQIYNIQVVRDASTEYGQINQNNQQIQQIKTQMQDSNFSSKSFFSFDDSNLFNACLLGWDYSSQYSFDLFNRLNVTSSVSNSFSTQQILYNQVQVKALTGQIMIGQNFTYEDSSFTLSCIILEDQATKQQEGDDKQAFTINVYAFCPQYIHTLNMTFSQDINGECVPRYINQRRKYTLRDTFSYQIQRVISVDNTLMLFNTQDPTLYQVDVTIEPVQVVSFQDVVYKPFSYNIISSMNIWIYFYRNGQLNVIYNKGQNNQRSSVFRIQQLLSKFNFDIGKNQQIYSVSQPSDNKFLIQYEYFYLYEITVNIDKNNELVITDARLLYYRDLMSSIYQILSGVSYTLVFGKDQQNKNAVALYDNSSIDNGQLIIKSSLTIDGQSSINFSSVQFTKDNSFSLYLFNGTQVNVQINNEIGIQVLYSKQQLSGQQLTVFPIDANKDKQSIKFNFQGTPIASTANKIYLELISLIIMFSILLL